MVLTIFLSTFLLHFIAAVTSEPQYILWISSVIKSHSTEKACVHLLNLNESVSLSVVLEYDGVNATVFDQSVEDNHFHACANFKVSQKSSEQLAFVTLLAKGSTLEMFERRSVAITSEEAVSFVQTDKPIYKPGENGEPIFLLPLYYTKTLPFEKVRDPQSNRIFQWQNVTSQNITQLSFQLISEPILGDYSITVEQNSGKTVVHLFTVNKSVLPKFEITINAPKTVIISDDEFQVAVCAKYTYGQPVQGKVQIQVCRKFYASMDCEKDNAICEEFIAQLIKGCASQIVNTKVFQLYRSGFFMSFDIKAIVTEIGTGVQISESTSVSVTQLLGSVSFENIDPFYRRGITYLGTLKFSGPNDVPMVSKLLQLEFNDKSIGNYTTDENGEAQFSIDTSDIFDPEFRLKATYIQPKSCYGSSWLMPDYREAYASVSRFYSRTNSFLKIVPERTPLKCNQQKTVTVHYSLNNEAYPKTSNVNFFYLVSLSRNFGTSYQLMTFLFYIAWNGNFSFPISVSADLAPVAIVFVYTLHPSGEIVADSVRFQVEKCFKNKVNIKFSKEKSLPGSAVNLHLQAAKDSLCALRAIDKSVLLLKPEQQLSADSVYNLLPYMELHGYFYQNLNLEDEKHSPCIPQKDMFYNGLYYVPASNYGDGDIYNILRDMGLKVFTNLHYRKPEICPVETRLPWIHNSYLGLGGGGYGYMPSGIACGKNLGMNYVEQAITETIRSNFQETWIWNLVRVNSSGSANLSFLIPDTITKWETDGFCVNGDVGFGISSAVTLEVFQNFFIETTLPFSMVQNEQSDLIVTAFNYLNTCAEISVWLEVSEYYEASSNTLPSNGKDIIQDGERKTYIWTIKPKKLGKVNITVVGEAKSSSSCPNQSTEQQNLRWKDIVMKSLLVEPEGIEKELTQSFLICTKGTKVSKQVVLDLPKNVVQGSARAFFTVVGDIFGLAIQNLENLVQTSYGCGEQNIALLASDTHVLDYLKATGQLTEEVKSKAVFFLSSGYQKQLSFKNSDGSYNVFCQSNPLGNIWLTTLTFKTFEVMKKYVYIDEEVQKQSLIWLSSKQKSNGCFKSEGKLFSNAWEGGDEEDVLLTAYIVGSLLEAGLNFTFPFLRNGLFCIEETLKTGVTNGYNQAILAYAFALAGKEEQVESLLQILDQSATKINNMIYWEKARKPKTEEHPVFLPRTPSAESEKTCYVLLAVISQKTPDLTYASQIVQWLSKQMNSHGGFSSTQDTAVCLLAITHYMKLTFSNDQNTVTFRIEEFSEDFQVNSDNRLLVQRSELPKAHGHYTVDMEGQGCSFVQATLRYNVPASKKASGFSLSLEIVKKNSSDSLQTNYNLTVTFNYTGIRNDFKMVLVDVKMLSGFTPVMSSLEELENSGQVMKTEVQNGHVLFFLESVFGITKNFTLSVEQSNLVSNIQPAPVMVYDYDEKDEYAIASYNIASILVSQ
ncbi:PREDICTED: ovostatin homolog 2-like [Chrysochloris asiatica]|uniref:Ovostatin homolog 2-like n=1 Tax=Chrysochloris asiatica TaxID=185453 RepID=A0A9B0UA62_CHRAS|nr:PREDICTED: ovostatin homolog 2-like [Chrysochloris asiatica]